MPEPDAAAPEEATTERHRALVDELVRKGSIRTPTVEAAFRSVPRHQFLPGVPLDRVYRDEAIPTHERDGVPISSSSQPAVMAIMLEQLEIQPGQRVLEIGAGTGYNAALLARLVGPTGRVVTIDLDEAIVAEARAHLSAAGVTGVDIVQADGAAGYQPAAPYDRIVLTVGAWDIAPAWIEQLAPGGRLLLPLWLQGAQLTVAVEPTTDDAGQEHLASVNVSACAFLRLRGAFAGPEAYLSLGANNDLTLGTDDRSRVDPARVRALLAGPAWDIPLPESGHGEGAFGFWLALREPLRCHVAAGESSTHPLAHWLPVVAPGYRFAHGMLADEAICLRVPADGSAEATGKPGDAPAVLRCFASSRADAEALARRYIDHIAAWDAAGRPSVDGVRLRVYPRDAVPAPPAAASVTKRLTSIAIDWA